MQCQEQENRGQKISFTSISPDRRESRSFRSNGEKAAFSIINLMPQWLQLGPYYVRCCQGSVTTNFVNNPHFRSKLLPFQIKNSSCTPRTRQAHRNVRN
jgi:hypothetical protein